MHNGLIDKRPALIARCANTADVADAVRFARAEGLELSVRGGGHNVAGKAVTEGGVMVDLAPMRGSYVDPARGGRRVQGGATWNDYNRATHLHGLATTGRGDLHDRRRRVDPRRRGWVADGPVRHGRRQPCLGRAGHRRRRRAAGQRRHRS